MENIPEFVKSIIVPIVVAVIGVLGALISAAINIKNKENRAAAFATVVSISITILMIVVIGGAFAWDIYALSHEEASILVANFDGIDSDQYRIAEFVRDRLRTPPNELQSLVIAGDRAITEVEGRNYAREIGSQWNAKVVVWGWYTIVDEFYLQLNLETLRGIPNNPGIGPSIKLTAQAKPDVLGAFIFQRQLGDDLSNTIYGMYCYSMADWDCAIENFSTAMEKMNTYVYVYDNPGTLYQYRGGAYYFSENYKLAVADFEVANNYSKDPTIYYALGLAYEKMSETVPAFTNYSIAANDYDEPNAYERLAIMAGKLNDPKKAVAYFEKAIDGNGYKGFGPTDPDEKKIIMDAYFHEGILSKDAQDNESALKLFNRIVNMDSKYYDVYYYRGETYMNLDQNELAIADFDRYVDYGTDSDLREKAKTHTKYLKYPQFRWFFDLFDK